MAYSGEDYPQQIDPLDLLKDSPAIVIRIGGNSITPRGTTSPDYDLLDGLAELVAYCAEPPKSVIVVPGGVGGHLFIEWAREAASSEAFINSLGCALIDIAAQILADQLARVLGRRDIAVCPRPATTINDLLSILSTFSVAVCQSDIRGAISSDSLALLVADAVESPLLSIKRQLPFMSRALPAPSGCLEFTHHIGLTDIEQLILADELVESAGWHHSLDTWALRLLRRPSMRLSFTTATSVREFRSGHKLTEVMKVTR
jgi:uridylate kinase